MNKPFFLAFRESSSWLIFETPLKFYKVFDQDDIDPVLNELDKQINAGYYVAGFLSYEASSGLDSAHISKKNARFPKLVFGIFDTPKKVGQLNQNKQAYKIGAWQPSQNRAYYDKNILKIKSAIAAGDTYQVNYTMRLNSDFAGDPRSFFCDLSRNQHANYPAYIEFDNYSICSVSPELFFYLENENLFCKPMKGTAARGLSYRDDLKQKNYLQGSAKERAENLMIVDMIRNDMGKVCRPGSVKTTKLFNAERYPTVWQMTSDIQGKTEASFVEIIRALFPCASITGAPKSSSMRIINKLERTPRNIYTGSIGYFGPDRKACFNVAIRTVLIDTEKGKAEYGVGGGIVWDSKDKNEYEECRVKAKILTQKNIVFDLLETILWDKTGGYFLLDYHLNRLANSAEYFLYQFDRQYIIDQLNRLWHDEKLNHKIRLLLGQSGQIKLEAQPITDYKKNIFEVRIANEPISKTDIFLYHKTTNRHVYQKAIDQASKEKLDDVLLCNEQGELTESTVANIVIEKAGRFFTPPQECGLLNGTYRQLLIDRGELYEKVIKKNELNKADKIFLINSVRKWREVKLI